MTKKIIAILIFIFLLFSNTSKVSAFEQTLFLNIANPVRGWESWSVPNQSPLDLPKLQYEIATPSALPVSWLLRFDALNDATISAYFKELIVSDSTQELGAFFEITPILAKVAGVDYPPGEYISAPNRIFLSGYSQKDRLLLIDTYMKTFFQKFGFYPRVVGAWYIDSYSLDYLQKHYSVVAAIICDEQYSTDNYRLWGSYLGSPYFPTKKNTMIPSGSTTGRIDLAIVKWAVRDPFNFYDHKSASAYSVQVNDYTGVGQNTNYLQSLLDIYRQPGYNEFSQIVIGLENDYDITGYGSELKRQYQLLSRIKSESGIKINQLSQFGEWLKRFYPVDSPSFFFHTKDISSNHEPGEVFWFQNSGYRIGLKAINGKTSVIDFRVYSEKFADPYYVSQNIDRILFAETPYIIDTVKFKDTELFFPIDLSEFNIKRNFRELIFEKDDQKINFQPDRIIFTNITLPSLSNKNIKVLTSNNQTTILMSPELPFSQSSVPSIIVITIIIGLFIFLVIRNNLSLLTILLGMIFAGLSLIPVFRSGLLYDYGYGLWGPNGHDAIFHLSLANHFAKTPFDFSNPQIYQEKIQNYHYAFDWLTGVISKLTSISISDLYFRILPIAIALSLVFLITRLLNSWGRSRLFTIVSLFGIFLYGSFGYLYKLIVPGQLFSGESVFWSNQSISMFLNPPFVSSILLLLIFVNFYSTTNTLLLSLIGGLLAPTKIYAFILLCLSLLVNKKIKLLIGVSFFGLLFLIPVMGGGASFPFIFSPLWFVKSMIEANDRLSIPKVAQAWQTWEYLGNYPKLIIVSSICSLIFIIGNLGIRVVGLYQLLTSRNKSRGEDVISSIIFFGILIPLLFVQNLNPWNTIQFLYYSLFFLAIYTSDFIVNKLVNSKNRFLIIISLMLIMASIPTTIGTIQDYLPYQSASRISYVELQALEKLKDLPPGAVISPLYNQKETKIIPDPKNLYGYVSTAYISALSGKSEYLSDTINLDITGYNYRERSKNTQRLYQTRDPLWVKEFLNQNHINYIYETPIGQLKIHPEQACLKKVFDSGEVNIYQFQCQ